MKPLVLLVEDNRTDVRVITEVLKELDLDTRLQIASDGDRATRFRDRIDASPEAMCPGLVLLDLNLPRVSGIEIIARIRKCRRRADVPVVIVTSSDSPDDLAAVSALNIAGYFQKPADLAEYMELKRIILQAISGSIPCGSIPRS